MDDKKLKILLVNHSDTAGGASVVTYRLMDALNREGADARMLVVHKHTDSLRVTTAASPRKSRLPFLAEHADIFLRNGFNRETLFKISTARYGLPLHRHPWVAEADIIVLNWINQGMATLKEVRALASLKPVVWTMHDQWNMTGVCHYTDGCERWRKDECRDCPLVGRGKLAHRVFLDKKRLYSTAKLHFVAVSNRLAELCRQSELMHRADITVIPNALPVEKFGTVPALSRSGLGLPENGRIVVMGAARLDDPVKNLPLAIETLNGLKTPDVTAVFFGDLRDRSLLNTLRIPYVYLGVVREHERLQSLMAHADVVLSTSVWETLPGTIVEGIAAGAAAVATDNGGQADIIEESVTGYLLPADCTPDVSSSILDVALSSPSCDATRKMLHQAMSERFGAPAVARAYIRLARKLTKQ